MIVGLIAATIGFQTYAHYRMRLPTARILLPYCGEDLLWGCLAGMVELRTRRGRLVVRVGHPCGGGAQQV